jgi:hypothetical protein
VGHINSSEFGDNVNTLNSGPSIPSQKGGLAGTGPQKRECILARKEAQTKQTILETESHSLDSLYKIHYICDVLRLSNFLQALRPQVVYRIAMLASSHKQRYYLIRCHIYFSA